MSINIFEGIPCSNQHAETMRSILSDSHNGRTHWDVTIKQYLPNSYLDNFTDFSDSTCFTYFIGCDDSRFAIGTKELSAFLSEGNNAYYVKMQISLLAPVICVAFCKYGKAPTALDLSDEPFTQSQQDVYSAIMKFAKDNNFQIKKLGELTSITAVLSGKSENAYSYLFEADE